VLLTDAEFDRLQTDHPNADQAIAYLDEYIQLKGYKAKDHNLAIRKWVFRAMDREQIEAQQLDRDRARLSGQRTTPVPDFAALAAAARSQA
jgi:hypothetical protein